MSQSVWLSSGHSLGLVLPRGHCMVVLAWSCGFYSWSCDCSFQPGFPQTPKLVNLDICQPENPGLTWSATRVFGADKLSSEHVKVCELCILNTMHCLSQSKQDCWLLFHDIVACLRMTDICLWVSDSINTSSTAGWVYWVWLELNVKTFHLHVLTIT